MEQLLSTPVAVQGGLARVHTDGTEYNFASFKSRSSKNYYKRSGGGVGIGKGH